MKDNNEQPNFKIVCASYGTKDCKKLDIEGSGDLSAELQNEIMEIKAWNSNDRPVVLSQAKTDEIQKNFMKRPTEYAQNIRNRIKENKDIAQR